MKKIYESFKSNDILIIIGIFKLFKATLLIITGISIIYYLKSNIDVAENFSDVLNLSPAHRLIHKLLIKASLIDKKTFKNISIGTFIYAAFFLTEGIGLIMRKKWAEYFTVIITASLVPLEIYELIKKITLVKSIVIVINFLIIIYLIKRLKQKNND